MSNNGQSRIMVRIEAKPARWLLLLAITLAAPDHRILGQQPKAFDGRCPDGKPARRDLYGDSLPEGAIARLGTVRMRHGQIISGMTFSADGKSIIASDFYSGVHVWDVAEGREVGRYFEDDRYCHCLALSPDGRTLAVALGDLSVRLCDPASGREFGVLNFRDRLNSVVFSSDGSLLATGAGREAVQIWRTATRQLVQTVAFDGHAGRVVFSSDGKVLACATQNGIVLWDIAQAREVRQIRNEPSSRRWLCAAFAAKGGPLAVWGYDDASIRLFDAGGAKEIRRIRPAGSADLGGDPWGWTSYLFVSFSPNGKLLATCRDPGRIELWDVENGKKMNTLVFDSGRRAPFMVFSPDGSKLASASSDAWGGDNTIRVWDLAAGKELAP